jgi:putative membrane protein
MSFSINSKDFAAQSGAITKKDTPGQWILRVVKGMIIVSGFLLPGISGGVLAVVLGIYEPLMRFLGDLRHNFKKNFFFLLPVLIGALLGLFLFSVVLDALFVKYEKFLLWFFIGGIAGTLPSIFKTSGEQGRKKGHWVVLVASIFVTYTGLLLLQNAGVSQIPTQSIWVWLFAGALMGLGAVLPGLGPSNFLIFLGLLEPLMAGLKGFDLGVIIPFFVGIGACVLSLAKLMNWLFDHAHATMYHIILGIVVGSTLIIIPGEFPAALISCAVFAVGLGASLWMGKNEGLKERK